MTKTSGRFFALGTIILLIGSAFWVAVRLDARPRTDDAFLEADVVHLAPEVSGRVVSLNIRNNQSVRAGDILFVIDPQPYELRRDAARAQTQALEAKIDEALNQIASQVSSADAARTAIDRARAQLELADSDLRRLEPVFAKGFVSTEKLDHVKTARDTARIALDQAIQQARSAKQAVNSVRPLEAQLAASRASEALAGRDLEKTVVCAPFDGKVVGLSITAGEYATAGNALFTLIDTSKWYAVANFRETEIAEMKPDTKARVYLMGQPDRPLSGHVDSIGWGVTPDQMSMVNGMPRVAKTLDWVRLAQRFPVRVKIDDPQQDMMRMGASAVVVVRHGDQQ